MMVVFDNSIFCVALHPDAKPRADVDQARERIEHLLRTLEENSEKIVLPAPAFAEFLVLAGGEGPEYVRRIRESSIFRIEPFGARAAIELASMELEARQGKEKRGPTPQSDWQKVKFDRQIIAIARCCGAAVIYSDDPDIAKHSAMFGIQVVGSADLPKPPPSQIPLGLADPTE